MSTEHHFFERRTVVEIDAVTQVTQVTHCGGGTWQRQENGSSVYRWQSLGGANDHLMFASHLKSAVASLLDPVPQASVPTPQVLAWIEAIQRKQTVGAIRFRAVSRKIVCCAEEKVSEDTQEYVQVELKAHASDGSRRTQAQRELFYPGWSAVLSLDDVWTTELARLQVKAEQKRHAVSASPGYVPVVIPPGADAAVLFHELCGHPLESDVVSRRCSYLGERLGQRIAPEFVSVVDDPTAVDAGVQYSMDDEGHPAARVALLAQGVVGTPIASSLGHGRRIDYRRQSLPRMAHTALLPHQGTLGELMAPVTEGILIHFLTPRHVDIVRGDFSFYIDEAQRIEKGKATDFIAPALLRGNGLSALQGIQAVGSDMSTFFGFKGCGKLDHGPLPVSFGNPSVRFSPLEVSPWI